MIKPVMQPPENIAGYNPVATAGDCRWDPDSALKAIGFFPDMLCHTQGFSGPFRLEQWQQDWIATLFGWKRPDGTRRYREFLCAIPRKNGKTALAAGIALYVLLCDGERGAQVYSAAFSRDQASLVFEPASQMVKQSPILNARCKIGDAHKIITVPSSGGKYRAIPADAANTHGFNAHLVLFDELHTQTTRDLYDVLKTSQGARLQPLFGSITTAGHNRNSICYEVWGYARKVRDGIVENPSFLPVIYELADGEDWQDRGVWQRVNPNLGVSISREFLEEEFSRAKEVPAYENTFRNLYLNQWTEQAVRWLPMDKWDACATDHGDLEGEPCWAGLDLSTVSDITALVLCFKVDGGIALECHFWVPRESAVNRERRDRVPYGEWIRRGHVTATPGNTVDYDHVRAKIQELTKRYRIRQIAVDRWNASQLVTDLQKDGAPVAMFGQGYASMSAPSKELERLVVDGELSHGGNPVLRWMAANVAIKPDTAGNIKPDKAASSERIDGIVAAIMAIGLATTDAKRPFIYASQGIRTL